MAETDALSGAKFGGGLYVKEYPVKLRVLTLNPMVYSDNKYGSTHYVFIVYNLDEDKVQVWDTSPGNSARLQEIHSDTDLGSNLRGIDIKVSTNGKSGKERRYTIQPIGVPHDLEEVQKATIAEAKLDLEAIVHKNNPGAIRLSDVNAGKKIPSTVDPENTNKDVVIEDIGDDPINIDDIPF